MISLLKLYAVLEFIVAGKRKGEMGRGVSSGGGQSSLGYLFGSQETANKPANKPQASQNIGEAAIAGPPQKIPVAVKPIDKDIPAGIHGSPTNNYHRAEGQNCGNFITV